ncbi:MAG: SPFH domain-containing protein [Pirellulaceae bacterium]|jgi:regulator of protease activity HflC (stomatin/prohibitin superfamily)|nr:SPFH domain-containing protein [Pirellulaceae bacterium]
MGIYVLQADEIGVRLTLGKFDKAVGPGLGFTSPILQRVKKTKSSLQTIDLPDQQIVLHGNIAVTISGNLNFRVSDPELSLLRVDNYRYTVQQFAMTTISDVLGTKTIEDVRGKKAIIANEIEVIVAETAANWGLADVDIRLTDARLDESLMRAMMRETEAVKEARAAQIRADGDRAVAEAFSAAASTLADSPGAMTLRILQTLSDLSNSKSTVVVPIPIDILSALGGKSDA